MLTGVSPPPARFKHAFIFIAHVLGFSIACACRLSSNFENANQRFSTFGDGRKLRTKAPFDWNWIKSTIARTGQKSTIPSIPDIVILILVYLVLIIEYCQRIMKALYVEPAGVLSRGSCIILWGYRLPHLAVLFTTAVWSHYDTPLGRFSKLDCSTTKRVPTPNAIYTSSESSRRDVSSADLYGADTTANTAVEISTMDNRPRGMYYTLSYTVPTPVWPKQLVLVGLEYTNYTVLNAPFAHYKINLLSY